MSEKIKVTDKRMFTAEGELRQDLEADRAPAPVPEAPARPAADESAPSSRSVPAPDAGDGSERAKRPAGPASAEFGPAGDLPTPTFMDLVGLLAQPIAMFLGDATMPGEKAEENLPLARFHIDLLELVQAKSQGNLSVEEAKLLEDLLYQLRLRYLEKAR